MPRFGKVPGRHLSEQSLSCPCRFVTKGSYGVMKGFAEEMWRKGGIRMVIMAGYQDDQGEIFSQVYVSELSGNTSNLTHSYDFNPDIANGPSFESEEAIQSPFDRFLVKCFQAEEQNNEGQESGTADKNMEGGKSRKSKSRIAIRAEQIKAVTNADGNIWIPDFSAMKLSELQTMIRAFLTAHYSKFQDSFRGAGI
jgi:hypothetical protein